MRVSKTAVYLLLLLLVTALAPVHVWGQSSAPGTKLRGSVLRARWRYHEGEAQIQCTPNGIPALELMSPPKHGTVRFVDADLGIPKGSGCINSVYGKAVFYRPDPGYVGKDRFVYNIPDDPMAFTHLGRPSGPWTVFVTVRDKN